MAFPHAMQESDEASQHGIPGEIEGLVFDSSRRLTFFLLPTLVTRRKTFLYVQYLVQNLPPCERHLLIHKR